jgi:hypothetical protein
MKTNMATPVANEVVERAYCLNLVTVFGNAVAASGTIPEDLVKLRPEQVQEIEQTAKKIAGKLLLTADKFGFLSYLSITEKRILVTPYASLKNQALLQATWRAESLQILVWALGLINKIPGCDTMAGDDLLNHLQLEKFKEFRTSAKLRAAKEIESARETAELWHWRSRTRELIEEKQPFPPEIPQFKSYDEVVRLSAKAAKEAGTLEIIDEDFSIKGKAYRDLTQEEWSPIKSIAFERHFALNWLCGYAPDNRWDETPTDT